MPHDGLVPSVTSTVWGLPSRRIVIVTWSPGRMASTALCRAAAEVTSFPANATMTSPPVGRLAVHRLCRCRGAKAGLFAGAAPYPGDRDSAGNSDHLDSEVGVLHLAALDELADDRADRARRNREADAVRAAGVALDLRVDADDTSLRSSSGPPELPWLIAASVWIVLLIVKLFGAVICLCSALTIPLVTVPSSPNGLRWRVPHLRPRPRSSPRDREA